MHLHFPSRTAGRVCFPVAPREAAAVAGTSSNPGGLGRLDTDVVLMALICRGLPYLIVAMDIPTLQA